MQCPECKQKENFDMKLEGEFRMWKKLREGKEVVDAPDVDYTTTYTLVTCMECKHTASMVDFEEEESTPQPTSYVALYDGLRELKHSNITNALDAGWRPMYSHVAIDVWKEKVRRENTGPVIKEYLLLKEQQARRSLSGLLKLLESIYAESATEFLNRSEQRAESIRAELSRAIVKAQWEAKGVDYQLCLRPDDAHPEITVVTKQRIEAKE